MSLQNRERGNHSYAEAASVLQYAFTEKKLILEVGTTGPFLTRTFLSWGGKQKKKENKTTHHQQQPHSRSSLFLVS